MNSDCLYHVAIYNSWVFALNTWNKSCVGKQIEDPQCACIFFFIALMHAEIAKILLYALKRRYQALILEEELVYNEDISIMKHYGPLWAGAELMLGLDSRLLKAVMWLCLSCLHCLWQNKESHCWKWRYSVRIIYRQLSPVGVPSPHWQKQTHQTLYFHQLPMMVLSFPTVKSPPPPFLEWQN